MRSNGERPALTDRQQEIYDFLKDKIMNRGYGPTVREIGTEFGIRSPNGVMCHLKALEKKGMIIREPHMSRAIQLTECPPSERMSIPLAGQIAAGKPVLAEEQSEKIDFSSLFDPETHFCLKVKGESMIDDQIADGDYVVITRQKTARNGQIVVALVDETDATLKRFYKEKDRFRLEPANKKMKPIYSKNVQILGIVSGVVRQYR